MNESLAVTITDIVLDFVMLLLLVLVVVVVKMMLLLWSFGTVAAVIETKLMIIFYCTMMPFMLWKCHAYVECTHMRARVRADTHTHTHT